MKSGLQQPPAKTFAAECDTAVLGAGVVGMCTAYALARRGHRVLLVDREAGPARRASFANGAQLSYAYSDALGSPGLLRKLPSLVLGSDPLFRVRFSLDPDFLRWGLRFLQSCSASAYEAGTLETLSLALESRLALHALLQRHSIAFGHAVPGKMHLYYDKSALSEAATMVALKRKHGAMQDVLSAREARALEPALHGAHGLEGVVFSPDDEVGDPYLFCQGLMNVLRDQYQVQTLFETEVVDANPSADGVVVSDSRGNTILARNVVVALGTGSNPMLRKLGLRAQIQPLKGYSFTAAKGPAAPQVSITDTARKLVFCNLTGKIRVAGGAELGNRDQRPDPAWLARLFAAARASLPDAVDFNKMESSWSELRPMSATSVPMVRKMAPWLVLNIGHGMLGWTLAMGAAERAARLVIADNRNADGPLASAAQ